MSLLVIIIPAAILTVLVNIILVVVGLFVKKEHQRFTGTEVVLGGIQFLSLAATSLAVVSVLFAAVDHMIPDALVDSVYLDNEGIRSALAVLFVTTPLFVFVVRKMVRTPSWMQRFVASCTLLLAGAVGVGVIIALIYNFLAGELGMRLLMKLATLGVVAGGIGWYYALSLHEGKAASKRATTVFISLLTLIVIKALVWGFVISGGPFAARAERFDDRRLSDLYGMQSAVQMYWEENGRLPSTATELDNPITSYTLPTDPETAAPYQYRRVSETGEPVAATGMMRRVGTFELCATFTTERHAANKGKAAYTEPVRDVYVFEESFLPYYYRDDSSPHWDHGIGKHCFTRTLKQRIEITPQPL